MVSINLALSHITPSLALSAIGLVVLLIGAVAIVLVYGRSEFHRNVAALQQQALDAQEAIGHALQTELDLRDGAIKRLEDRCDRQALEITALHDVVAQGTQVAALIVTVDGLRRDVLGRLDAMAAP